MIYAMSDLHGCYELYLRMLDKIAFSSEKGDRLRWMRQKS